MSKVTFNSLMTMALSLANAKVYSTFCLLGPPGSAKTAWGEEFARQWGATCLTLDMTALLAEDILGPLRSDENGTSSYRPPANLYKLAKSEGRRVLILDDLPAATDVGVLAGVRQLIYYKRIGDLTFEGEFVVIVTGNRVADFSGAKNLPAHARNTMLLLELETTLKEWSQWFSAQPDLDPMVLSWVQNNADVISSCPDVKPVGLGSYTTYRSLSLLAREIAHVSDETIVPLCIGRIGEKTGASLAKWYLEMRQLPPVEDYFNDPNDNYTASIKKTDNIRHSAYMMAVVSVGAKAVLAAKSEDIGQQMKKTYVALYKLAREGKAGFNKETGEGQAETAFAAAHNQMQSILMTVNQRRPEKERRDWQDYLSKMVKVARQEDKTFLDLLVATSMLHVYGFESNG